jgi:HEAT repeat protein
VLPFVDDVHEGNTEARRAVVAELSRVANPGTTQLLRRLLCDTKAEIRCDASIALNSLEDKMAHELHLAFAAWRANPTDIEHSLTCIDHSYRYATSNVLDAKSQRFYLLLVYDLLQQVLAGKGHEDAALWVKLADVHQRLGQLPEALQAALQAVHLRPAASDVSLLAMDLAFRSHAWDILYSLAGQHVDTLPEVLPFQHGQAGTASCGPGVWEEERYE